MTEETRQFVTFTRQISVSPAGYQKLLELAEQYKVCQYCSLPYTAERPNVALNACLLCFLPRIQTQHRSLQFVGPKDAAEGVFLYIDNTKFIHYSTVTSKESYRSHAETLNYWRYPYPEETHHEGRPVIFTPGDWKLHGRPGASAAVIAWQDVTLMNKIFVFLTYCNEDYQYLDKHLKATRDLFKQARARAEQTRDKQGYYHLSFEYGPYTRDLLTDEDLYPVIAQIKSEEHDDANPSQPAAE